MIDFPIPQAFVVAEGDRTQAKFDREIARRTFEHSGLRAVTQFLHYGRIRDTWQRYQRVGGGSGEWSSGASSEADIA